MDTDTGIKVRTFSRFNLPGPARPAERVPLAAGQRGTFSDSYNLGCLVQGEHFILLKDARSGEISVYINKGQGAYTPSGYSLRVLPKDSYDCASFEIITRQN